MSNSDEQAAEKYGTKEWDLPNGKTWKQKLIGDKTTSFKAGVQWQQSQPDHTQSEIIAGYIHEVDSLRETNRKLGEQIKSQPEIPDDIELVPKSELENAELSIGQLYDQLKDAEKEIRELNNQIRSRWGD